MISIILGTRPEIIKMSPVIRECQRQGMEYFILHTGQHYSYNMDKVFFEQLGLPEAKYNLDAGSGMHGEQTGKMLAGALAAAKLHIKVGHVEAGLRRKDLRDAVEIIIRRTDKK
jgi:UDP-N-acetylglucosamine 2-epimerase (non-hydrolysing)